MSKTKISIEEVRRLASLSALEFVDQVKNCDTDDVEIEYTSHKLATLREDEAKESSPQEEILMNSPKTKKGSFCVPKMLD